MTSYENFSCKCFFLFLQNTIFLLRNLLYFFCIFDILLYFLISVIFPNFPNFQKFAKFAKSCKNLICKLLQHLQILQHLQNLQNLQKYSKLTVKLGKNTVIYNKIQCNTVKYRMKFAVGARSSSRDRGKERRGDGESLGDGRELLCAHARALVPLLRLDLAPDEN